MTRLEAYSKGLLRIANEADVVVEFLETDLEHGDDWDGLYLVCSELGPGIAINKRLPKIWQVWVLAHELGHHFDHHQRNLFSPFAVSATVADRGLRRRWGTWRKEDKKEIRANSWAALQLIDPQEWDEAETDNPCNLEAILKELKLPPPAALAWERLRRGATSGEAFVPLSSDAYAVLQRRINGRGGHQAFFSRLKKSIERGGVILSRSDFSYARQRMLTTTGGWCTRYKTLLDAVEPLIKQSGGVNAFFTMGKGNGHRGSLVEKDESASQLQLPV